MLSNSGCSTPHQIRVDLYPAAMRVGHRRSYDQLSGAELRPPLLQRKEVSDAGVSTAIAHGVRRPLKRGYAPSQHVAGPVATWTEASVPVRLGILVA